MHRRCRRGRSDARAPRAGGALAIARAEVPRNRVPRARITWASSSVASATRSSSSIAARSRTAWCIACAHSAGRQEVNHARGARGARRGSPREREPRALDPREARDACAVAEVASSSPPKIVTVQPARALLIGAAVGAVGAISNVFVSLKAGWSLPVMTTAAVVGLGVARAQRRELGAKEAVIATSLASSIAFMTGGGNLAAVPAGAMLGLPVPSAPALVVWFALTAILDAARSAPRSTAARAPFPHRDRRRDARSTRPVVRRAPLRAVGLHARGRRPRPHSRRRARPLDHRRRLERRCRPEPPPRRRRLDHDVDDGLVDAAWRRRRLRAHRAEARRGGDGGGQLSLPSSR